MSDTQFSTLLRLITELSDKLDNKIDGLRNELKADFRNELRKHRKQCHEEHMEILKAMEMPYTEHEKRITHLEQVVYK